MKADLGLRVIAVAMTLTAQSAFSADASLAVVNFPAATTNFGEDVSIVKWAGTEMEHS